MKDSALGKYGAQFFALVQMRQCRRVRLGDLQSSLGLSAIQEQGLLMRLAKNGYIFRLQRGIYLVPAYIPAGESWQPNELYIIAQYMDVQQANYFIGGQYAFHYYGFTQQLAAQIVVYNDKISGLKKFGKLSVRFVKIPTQKITGYIALSLGGDLGKVNIATVARTVFDAINDSRYRLLPEAYVWFEKYLNEPAFLEPFLELLRSCANKNTIRRMGYYLEKRGFRRGLKGLSDLLEPTSAWVCMEPTTTYQGVNNKKWGVIDNAQQS